MSDKNTTPLQYLEMWLSEQIPVDEWLEILKENSEVNSLYQKHMSNKKKLERMEEEYAKHQADNEDN
tara:strand:+ start:541 stop:741 length:201 start_codon:yes stop_codon:yes gene_type:complete